ncbi:hypothetical protein C8J56DRAFT_904000 [Mycena floridula]|nr:hypothetical protein C8J56DRAFT_904000 [Mycena floridula]
MSLQDGTSAELRAAKHEKHMGETIPNHLRWHEALLEKSSGTYYAGDTIPRHVRHQKPSHQISKYHEGRQWNHHWEYAEERRDARLTLRRQWKWNSEKFEFINEELERLGFT